MKLALAYSTKDRIELTIKSFERAIVGNIDRYWNDASNTPEGLELFDSIAANRLFKQRTRVTGGADAAIVFALSQMLSHVEYTHVGLLENDVLLDVDWLEPTMALFDKGAKDGLVVGAASARSYVDRVLVQRDGYALMCNIGAGHIIFTRQAAEIILRNYRTGYTSENWRTFALLSGIDIRPDWCFGPHEHATTADWHWDTLLAHHGLATLALTPAKATMIGQNIEEQGLKLIDAELEDKRNNEAFDIFRERTKLIREGKLRLNVFDRFQVQRGNTIYYPHQLHMIGGQYSGDWGFKWAQGFGPFAYQAGVSGGSLFVPVYGACSFLVSGGKQGANVELIDRLSGFRAAPQLAPDESNPQIVEITVPGTNAYRMMTLGMSAGGMFYGVTSVDRQPEYVERGFSYADLPQVAE